MKHPPEQTRLPLPTAAELEILAVLWANGESTVREVHEALLASKSTGYTTILKQMQVMVEKGLLQRNERFKSHVYKANLTREMTQQLLVADLMNRAFEGNTKSFVLGALSAQRASQEEIEELRKLLDEYEKGLNK
jgi:BlaI family transcriptional regulator, penicillinase repressor